MARTRGTLGISANFEPKTAAPFDARSIVATKAELILQATWVNADGNVYTYKGMVVSVTDDPTATNNGIYRLKAADYTVSTNWEIAGTGAGGGTHTHDNKAALDLINKDVNNNPTWNGGAWPGGGGGVSPTADNVDAALQGYTEATPTGDSYIPFIGKVKAKLSAVTTVIGTLLTNTFAAKTHEHTKSDISDFPTIPAAYVHPNHSGDVTSVADGATTIAEKAVTLAKMADIATASILGRKTALTGVPEVLNKTDVLTLLNVQDGANNYTHPTDDGNKHVPATGTNNSGKVLTAGETAGAMTWETLPSVTPEDNSITNAKLAKTAAGRIKGSKTSGDGSIEDLTPAEALELIGAKAATYKGAFDEETLTPTSSTTVTLKNSTVTSFNVPLTNAHNAITITLPTPKAGEFNQSILFFEIGASLPTNLSLVAGCTPFGSVDALTVNTKMQIIYSQIKVGAGYTKILTFSKV